ncbi:peptidoglycan DD-metalloendopeptidase family protein [Arenibacter algicola]
MRAHLDSFTVKKGNSIPKGIIIGIVGYSEIRWGCHLHCEILKFDNHFDH